MAPQTRHPETLLDDPGIWFGVTVALVILTLLVTGLAGFGTWPTATAVLLVGGVAAARLPIRVALVLGIVAWAFFTGFVENAFGQLTFAAPDLLRLVAFAAATGAIANLVHRLPRQGALHG